jgi:hypothetical protein
MGGDSDGGKRGLSRRSTCRLPGRGPAGGPSEAIKQSTRAAVALAHAAELAAPRTTLHCMDGTDTDAGRGRPSTGRRIYPLRDRFPAVHLSRRCATVPYRPAHGAGGPATDGVAPAPAVGWLFNSIKSCSSPLDRLERARFAP